MTAKYSIGQIVYIQHLGNLVQRTIERIGKTGISCDNPGQPMYFFFGGDFAAETAIWIGFDNPYKRVAPQDQSQ